MNQRLLDYRPELEFLEVSSGTCAEDGDELTLAARLLELRGATQLDRFIDAMVRKDGGPAPLADALKRAARQVLPLHRWPGAPVIESLRRRGKSDPIARAARIFGVELEGLSPEDKEFELAQRFVRFAREAIRLAADAVRPAGVAAALAEAARSHAPGLLQCEAGRVGRWQRQGDRIVVYDC
ncbi:MAG TPA: hypothetical protein VJ752_18605 [Burkholderiaceae bacterium]|nr:hypothetical protein [Burkholderiaceae bacterium]